MKMKKFLTVFLMICFCMTFFGCGAEEIPSGVPSVSEPEQVPVTEEVVQEEQPKFTLGVKNEYAYENEFFGIGFCFPDEGWRFYSDEEIEGISGVTAEMIGDDFEAYLETSQSLHGMFATTDGQNVNITFEKLDVTESFMTEEQYIDLMIPQYEAAMAEMGAQEYCAEKLNVYICGKILPGLKVSYFLQDVASYQILTCCKRDAYVANITISSFDTDLTYDMVNAFYMVE